MENLKWLDLERQTKTETGNVNASPIAKIARVAPTAKDARIARIAKGAKIAKDAKGSPIAQGAGIAMIRRG